MSTDRFLTEQSNGVCLLRMASPKANSMSEAMLRELGEVVAEIAAGNASAVVITGSGRAFSAGLALPDLVAMARPELRSFMSVFTDTMRAVLTLPKPTVAAVNGHAIAGGCVLALMCDFRIMASGLGRIGLNEVQLGLGLPAIVIEPLRARVPARSVGRIALGGELLTPADALDLGLVDEVVAIEALEARALERTAAWPLDANAAFAQVKSALLRPVLCDIALHDESELERWLDTWYSPAGQRLVGEAVSALTRK